MLSAELRAGEKLRRRGGLRLPLADLLLRHPKNGLKYALDGIAAPETMRLCYACIGRAGGKYTSLEARLGAGPDALRPAHRVGAAVRAAGDAEARAFGEAWFRTAQVLLDEGQLRAHPRRLMPGGLQGGLQGVLDGMDLLRNGHVSGEKVGIPCCLNRMMLRCCWTVSPVGRRLGTVPYIVSAAGSVSLRLHHRPHHALGWWAAAKKWGQGRCMFCSRTVQANSKTANYSRVTPL